MKNLILKLHLKHRVTQVTAAAFILAFVISYNPISFAANQTVEISFINDNAIGCHRVGDTSDTTFVNGQAVWTAQIRNHGPGGLFIEKAAFHDPISGCSGTMHTLRQDVFSMSGQTHFAEGQIGSTNFAYNVNSFNCGRVQVDAAYRNDDGSRDGRVFLGELIDYGVDCPVTNPPPPPPTNNPPIGSFDAVNCDILGGWAVDMDSPSTALTIEIFANGPEGSGTKIASLVSNTPRPDVNAAYGITGIHGFTISTPSSIKDGAAHEIWIYAQDTSTGSNWLFDNRKVFDSSTCPVPNRPPFGILDVANCDIIGGWAVDLDTPSTALTIKLYADNSNTAFSTIQTTGLRPDVNAAYGITGNHGFTIFTPLSFKTGTHSISATAIDSNPSGTNFVLSGSPKIITECTPPTPGTIGLAKTVRNVSKSESEFVNSTSADPGDTVEFKIIVTASNGNVSNVLFSDQLPSKLNYVTNSLSVDSVPAGNNLGVVSLGNMAPGQSKAVMLRAVVAAPSQFTPGTTSTLTNTGSVTSSSNSAQDTADVIVNVPPTPTVDLNVTKKVRNVTKGEHSFNNSTAAKPGDTVEFQIVVGAVGNTPALNVNVDDTLPANFTFTSGSANTSLGSINQGSSKTVLLSAKLDLETSFPCGSSTHVNNASASSYNAGIVSDSASVVVDRSCNPTMTIDKKVKNATAGQTAYNNSTSAKPGDSIHFRIEVRNTGSGSAQNVTVVDTLPANFTISSGSTTINLGTMAPGATQTININGVLTSESTFVCGDTTITNTAKVTATSINPLSDSADVMVNRECVPDNVELTITKKVKNITAYQTSFIKSVSAKPGDTVEFQIVVGAVGNTQALNVNVNDILPQNFTFTSGSANTSLGSINAGSSKTVTLRAIAAADTNFPCGSSTWTNTATASASNAPSVSDSAGIVIDRVCVTPKVDLTIDKQARNVTAGQTNFSNSVTAHPGDAIQFQITVSAVGNTSALNVNVNDTLPPYFTLTTGSTSTSLGTIDNGSMKTVTLTAAIADESKFNCGSVKKTNSATASASNAGSVTDSADVNIEKVCNTVDLSIDKKVRNVTAYHSGFANSASAKPGDTVEFQIVVSATGNTNALNVNVNDALPANFTLTAGSINTNLGSINAGSSKTVNLTAKIGSESYFSCGSNTKTNTATASASNTTSVSDAAMIVVDRTCATPKVDLTIDKKVRNTTTHEYNFSNSTTAKPGETVEFQITVSASGNTAALDVNLADTLPANFTLASGATNTSLGTINVGSTKTVTLKATLAGANNFTCGTSTSTNKAQATSSNASTVSDNATVDVNRICTVENAVLTLTKEVKNVTKNGNYSNITNAVNDDKVQFRLTVRNTSTSTTATNVRLSDQLPNGLSFNSGSVQVDSGPSSGTLVGGTLSLGNLNPNGTRVVTFTATVKCPSGQTLVNTATATADNANSANAQASVVVGVVQGGSVDLVLSKKAYNKTKSVDATTTSARSYDLIKYTLTVENRGNLPATNYVFQDDISDVLQLSQLQSFNGAEFDMAKLSLKWPAVTIPAHSKVDKTFTVKVNGKQSYKKDNVMTNTFGNTVNVRVGKTHTYFAPPSGGAATMTFVLSGISLAGYIAFRRRTVKPSVIN